jgi:hypothetical protein
MGRGHATRSMEPQHYSMKSNKLYAFLINIWSGGGAARGNETSKLTDRDRVPVCPSEAEEKDLLGSNRLKAVTNL